MGSISDLGLVSLTIPAWHMALYIGLVSVFLIWRKGRWAFLLSYLFSLYWGYYLFAKDFLNATRGDTTVQAAYLGFGLGLLALIFVALFYEEG